MDKDTINNNSNNNSNKSEEVQKTDEIIETAIPSKNEYKIEMDRDAVINRLSSDIYENEEAGVRELISNGVTAIKKSVSKNQINIEDGVLTVKIREIDKETTELTIEDNGIGMSRDKLSEVVSVIGRSTSINDGSVSGQFGMGILSMFKLSGMDGIVEMSTRSRETDETISGTWERGQFKETSITDEKTTYGTRFKIVVKDSISSYKLKEWTVKNLEWTRVNAMFEYIDQDNNVRFDDEWSYDRSFESNFNTTVKYEDEYVEAVANTNNVNETVLLDVPVERNKKQLIYGPKQSVFNGVCVRVKNENRVVFKGPNKGKEVVDYDPTEGQIKKSNLKSDDIWTPAPVGTRDTLESNKPFWNYVSNRLEDVIDERIDECSNMESLNKIINKGFKPYAKIVRYNCSGYGLDDFKKDVVDKYGFNESLAKQIAILGKDELDQIKFKSSNCYEVCNLTVDSVNSGDYIGVSINKNKAKTVVENKNKQVFKVPSTDWYEPLKQFKNCKLLKNVDVETKFVSTELYVYGLYNSPRNKDINHISDDIVLFPEHMDKKISEYRSDVVKHGLCAKCTKQQYEEFKDMDNVYLYDEFASGSLENEEITLINGESLSLMETDGKSVIVDLSEEFEQELTDGMIESYKNYIDDKKYERYNYDNVYLTVNSSVDRKYINNLVDGLDVKEVNSYRQEKEYYNLRKFMCDDNELLESIRSVKGSGVGCGASFKDIDELFRIIEE